MLIKRAIHPWSSPRWLSPERTDPAASSSPGAGSVSAHQAEIETLAAEPNLVTSRIKLSLAAEFRTTQIGYPGPLRTARKRALVRFNARLFAILERASGLTGPRADSLLTAISSRESGRTSVWSGGSRESFDQKQVRAAVQALGAASFGPNYRLTGLF